MNTPYSFFYVPRKLSPYEGGISRLSGREETQSDLIVAYLGYKHSVELDHVSCNMVQMLYNGFPVIWRITQRPSPSISILISIRSFERVIIRGRKRGREGG